MTDEATDPVDEEVETEEAAERLIYVKGHKPNEKNATHHVWGEYHGIMVPAEEYPKLLKKKEYAKHPQEFAETK